MRVLKVAALQMASLPLEKAKLDYYLSVAKSKKASVVVLGEYVTNLFFKELEKTPKAFIVEQSSKQASNLANLAKIYNMHIIAPIVLEKNGNLYKTITHFSPTKNDVYLQQILMPYSHWNEAKFFANEKPEKQNTKVIAIDGFKIAIMSGFEAHFDNFWNKKIDLAIVPSVATFESKPRWRSLLQTRAFTHNCYVLRVNRIGEYIDSSSHGWRFYGDSFCVDPFGEIEIELSSDEEIAFCDITKSTITEARRLWRFDSLAC